MSQKSMNEFISQVITPIEQSNIDSGWGYQGEATRRMLTEFGFSENDLSNGGKIIQI